MPSPIFIDANIPIYAGGQPHPLREPCLEVLQLARDHPRSFWTDAEVLQELIHRYLALRRWPRGREVFQGFTALMVGRIEPIYGRDVGMAGALASRHAGLSARDLLHVAVMTRQGANQIVSADRGFDQVPGIERLDPLDLSSWRNQIELAR